MNDTRETLAALMADIESAPVEDLPALIGNIEATKARALARLNASPTVAAADRFLTVDEAADLIGTTSRWIRNHQHQLPRVALPGRALRFSERGLREFLRRRTQVAG